MSIASIIARYSSLPQNDVREWSEDTIEDMESAILFVLALWSGQSIAAFKKLTERLAGTPPSPSLFVCDIDTLSAEIRKQFGSLQGVGETFWIRNGQVVASMRDYTSVDWSASVDRNNETLRTPPPGGSTAH